SAHSHCFYHKKWRSFNRSLMNARYIPAACQATPYDFGEWKDAKVHPDCHIQIGKNFYSVPHTLRGKSVEVRITSTLVEAYSNLDCVARHIRAHPNSAGQYINKPAHLPEAHKAVREA